MARSETSLGKANAYAYSNQRKLLSETEMKSDGTQSISKSYRYDVAGNLRFAVDGRGNATEYAYDALDRKVSEKVPVTVNGAVAVQTTTTEYDANGNVTGVTDFLGNKYVNAYDPLNRVTEKRDPAGNIIEKSVYNDDHQQTASVDALNNTTTFGYDRAGRLTSTKDASSNTTIHVDMTPAVPSTEGLSLGLRTRAGRTTAS